MSEKSAQVIKDFLRINRVTKTELARVTGISRFSVYKYLDGSNIHPKTAKQIRQKIFDQYNIAIPLEKLID